LNLVNRNALFTKQFLKFPDGEFPSRSQQRIPLSQWALGSTPISESDPDHLFYYHITYSVENGPQ